MSRRELSSPPSLTALYPRAVGVPLLRKVPGLGASGELPDTELEVRDVRTDLDHLSDYTEVCGFDRMDRLPATYPHIVAFPLAMRIMAERSFPFPVLGLVHIANDITQHRPISPDEPLTVRVRAQDLEPHDRGTQFAMAAEARAGDELVWDSRNVYLHRSKSGSGSGSGGGKDRAEPAPATAHWRVPEDIGRRYGAVSGDRNPIHLHGWSAKLFGMPRPIAHGMWLKARCLAELETTLPDAFSVEVRFKLPLFLPAQVAFGRVRDGHERFEVRDASSGKPHLSGELTPGA
jgi:MaoC like domain